MTQSVFQHSIKNTIMCAGIGVHSGERVRLTLKPAPAGSGLIFIRTDLEGDNVIPARGDCVSQMQLSTTLSNSAGASVSTVEHLVSSCAGLGIDNLFIEIDGPEVPIMDGSAKLFTEMFLNTGLKRQMAARRFIRIKEPVTVDIGSAHASLLPHNTNDLVVDAKIEYDNSLIGVQHKRFTLSQDAYINDLAFARTFGFAKDLEHLRSMGFARGGSLDNAILIEDDIVVNPEGLRSSDEFIRHKILDVVGDLYLCGAPIIGLYQVTRPGHALNNKLVCALLSQPECWRWEIHTDPNACEMDRVAAQ